MGQKRIQRHNLLPVLSWSAGEGLLRGDVPSAHKAFSQCKNRFEKICRNFVNLTKRYVENIQKMSAKSDKKMCRKYLSI